jgi:hypothetical protein
MISQFLSPVNDLLTVGFQAYNSALSPFNAAFAANSEHAITGIYPALSIDYEQVVIAKGRLLAVPQVTVATTVDAQLDLTWLNNAGTDSSNGTDKITFLVYNPSKQAYVKAQNAALRSALSFNLVLPSMWSQDSVHIWAFFVSANGKISSDSTYLGNTVVQ